MGRSDIFLKLEIIKKTLGTVILVVSVVLFDDVLYIAYGGLLIAILSSVINMFPNTKLIGYSYKEQLMDLLPNAFITGKTTGTFFALARSTMVCAAEASTSSTTRPAQLLFSASCAFAV